MRILARIAAVAGTALLLAACGSDETSVSRTTTTTVVPGGGGTGAFSGSNHTGSPVTSTTRTEERIKTP